VKSENSLAWLNLGQALITNVMLAGGMGFVVWRWSRGEASAGDVVFVSTLLAQLSRPLDLLGMVYRTIRQGALDMAAMFDLIDTPATVVDAPGAPALAVSAGHVRFEGVSFGYDAGRPVGRPDTKPGIDVPHPDAQRLPAFQQHAAAETE
jgi:ATP-binding cassette subfamily B protein